MSLIWITNTQRLMDRAPLTSELFLVKLLYIIAHDPNEKPETITKICPARIALENNRYVWHINDVLDDNLLIEVPTDNGPVGHLGYAILPNDDEVFVDELKHDVPHDMYVIAGCQTLDVGEIMDKQFVIIDERNNETIAEACSYREAVGISDALMQTNIKTTIRKIINRTDDV